MMVYAKHCIRNTTRVITTVKISYFSDHTKQKRIPAQLTLTPSNFHTL